jgi:hypothetical protein
MPRKYQSDHLVPNSYFRRIQRVITMNEEAYDRVLGLYI